MLLAPTALADSLPMAAGTPPDLAPPVSARPPSPPSPAEDGTTRLSLSKSASYWFGAGASAGRWCWGGAAMAPGGVAFSFPPVPRPSLAPDPGVQVRSYSSCSDDAEAVGGVGQGTGTGQGLPFDSDCDECSLFTLLPPVSPLPTRRDDALPWRPVTVAGGAPRTVSDPVQSVRLGAGSHWTHSPPACRDRSCDAAIQA